MATILIVDDHCESRQFLVTLLGYRGHRVLEADDGAAALEAVRAERPDLVITDILMPTMDGFEFIRQLRVDPAIAHTPVIFYSAGYQKWEAGTLAEAGGIVHCLSKPAEPEVILHAVDEALLETSHTTLLSPAAEFDREHRLLVTNKLARKVVQLEYEIAERQRSEAALRRREEQLRLALGTARMGTWDWDLPTGCLEWSDSLYPLYGLTPGAFAGTFDALLDLVHPDDRALVVEETDRAVRQGPDCSYEFRVIWPDGSTHWLTGQGGVIRDPDGRAIRLLGVALDVTERRRDEEALRASAERLQLLSRRIVEVQEEERRHLARELHDEIGQVLTAISVNLHAVKGECAAATRPRMEESIDIVDRAIQQVRNLSLDLRPSMLDDLGLVATLRWYADRQGQRAGFVVHFALESSAARLPKDLEIACYRVAQEALTNVVRHARARRVWLDYREREGAVQLVIRDDGVGFDPAAVRRRAARGASFGVLGMQERVELLGGRIDFESGPGRGSSIRIRIPCASREESGPGSPQR